MTPRIFNKNIILTIIFTFVITAASHVLAHTHQTHETDKVFKVGVRAVYGVVEAKKMWSKTINVLNKNIKDHRFELVPILGFHDMRTAAKNKKIDFILTNPLAYIQLNKQSGLTRLLTLNKKQPNGVASTTFAAVIFTRSDRADINNLNDLYDKAIMGVHDEAFGGWRMALYELLLNNFDPYEDSRKVLFTQDNTHQAVVYSVLAGDADVGVVRTGIIEKLVKQGKIKLNSIKILNAHKDNLPVLHSTEHYPEWPFAVMPHVPNDVSNKVFHALLKIQAISAAAIAGKYVSWTAPLDYSDVYNLAKTIDLQHITFAEIWDKHWLTILLFQVFMIAIIFYTFYLFSINRKLITSEFKLSQHRDHLEELVNARTEELTTEKIKADKANREKSRFLSNMSHELRTPLNSILGFSELIKMDNADTGVSENADEIIAAGKYLLSLINEILDLAAIESGKSELKLEKISFNEMLNHSVDIIKPLLDKKNIVLTVNKPSECFIFADSRRIQQICINLLSNAIKYNKESGDIEVTLGSEEKGSRQCKLTIKDSGIGIKPEFYERVFQPFARDRGNLDIIEGTGVGLVITKHLIEQMQGSIGFNSEYGTGTEFWVTLPAIEAE